MAGPMDDASPSDIAIVGMALRVPGASTPDAFWHNLKEGVESVRTLSREELEASGEAAELIDRPNYVARTAELPDMEMFDADFFGMSPKDAAIMDPQHRHFLECAWSAMEDAGLVPDRQDGPIGVFAGCGMGSYFYFNLCSQKQLVDDVGMFLLRHTGNDKDFLATRVSFAFDLRGPSVTVQTACSTSLVAVHQACQSLLNGECDAALAGGVTIEQPHRRGYLAQEGEILSPDGHCRPFDHRAAGTIFGSGAGVVVLKRLADAVADGDVIHAVIKATAVNNDGGQKSGYLAPSVTGQASAAIEAMGMAGISADTIHYVECHGTGTYLGDPIEIQALTEAFRQSGGANSRCYVGSVKSNIGHLDTAAGVVSLIKTVLALKHGQIPPTLGFEKPNPAIPFDKGPFRVADRLLPWPQASGRRRAAVNSLGVGGTNAHAILEAYEPLPVAKSGEDQAILLPLSGRSREAVIANAQRLADAFEIHPELRLDDAAYTLAKRRRPFDRRAVLAARDRADAIAALRAADPRRLVIHDVVATPGPVVFLLPGGGAQYAGMARELHRSQAEFRGWVEEGLGYLPTETAQRIRAAWLFNEGTRAEADAALQPPSIQLPAIAILEVALARLWMSKGVKPGALLGHSMGENAAACIAGVMSFRDMVRLVHLRGRLFETVPRGGMLAVSMPVDALQPLMPGDLSLASVNAPGLCVVSGADEALSRFQAVLAARDIDCNRVPIDIAAHSHMLDGILAEFEAFLRTIALSAPAIPILSNVTGTWLTESEARDPLYWVRHLRSTVQFSAGLALLAQNPQHIYLEVGPGRVLSSMAKLQAGIAANQVINSLPHPAEEIADDLSFLSALGRLWAVGLDIDPAAGLSARHASLPTYAFQHKRYFIERAAPAETRAEPKLQRQDDMADWGFEPVWKPTYAEPLAEPETSCWLALTDGAATTTAALERLRGLGHTVITVRRADAFARFSATEYGLCVEDGEEAYRRLLDAIKEDGYRPTRILHALLVSPMSTIRMGADRFLAHQDSGFLSLFSLVRALDAVGMADAMHMDVVTTGMQSVGSEDLPYPEKALILGPALVIPKEYPGITIRLIDLNDGQVAPAARPRWAIGRSAPLAPQSDEAALLWDDLTSNPSSEMIAYRDGKRWRRDTRRLSLAERATPRVSFRTRGVYMLTGGLGDIALTLATDLVDRYDAAIILVGRNPLPEREQWPLYLRLLPETDSIVRAIRAIAPLLERGARILTLKADVTSVDDMTAARAKAEAAFGPINGVLHTAGVVKDDLIPMKTLQDMDAVLAPKVHGTLVLDRVFETAELDFLALFSSTSSDLAPVGQVDYVAANAFLNAYADSRKGHPTRSTVAIHWGIWSDIGIAARALAARELPGHGETVVEPADGPVFEHWVKDGEGQSWLEVALGAKTHWFIDEHRLLDGSAVVPGTAYLEFIVQAVRDYGFTLPVSLTNLRFLQPVFLEDRQTRRLRVRLKPSGGAYQVLIVAETGDDFVIVADAQLQTRETGKSGRLAFPHDWDGLDRSLATSPAIPSIQEDRIRFGPRWQVLRQVRTQGQSLHARLALPGAGEDDLKAGYALHPGLMDIATGSALALLPSEALGDGLWIPVVYGRLDVYRALPADLVVAATRSDDDQPDGFASFDIELFDLDGQRVASVGQYVMKRLDGDDAFAPSARTAGETGRRTRAAATASAEQTRLARTLRLGIRRAEGLTALERALATGRSQPIVTSIDLAALTEAAKPDASQEARPVRASLDADPGDGAPRSPVEQTLTAFWKDLLGVPHVGLDDDFFEIGGHSLIAVRLFRSIKKAFAIDIPMSVLFEAPTIAQCARLIEEQIGTEPATSLPAGGAEASAGEPARTKAPALSTRHAVLMSPRDRQGTPLFICAGMFGNILNLRQLALHLSTDRPVYGMQARGLFGGLAPHETFEDMAEDYLAEIRQIQPSGPYYLAGFSGGGLVAYEMAQRLTAAGETVAQVVMLDTPIPGNAVLSPLSRLEMKIQDLRRHRLSFFSNWAMGYVRWFREIRERRSGLRSETGETQFHNRDIEAAFYRALARYVIKPYAGPVLLLRPKLEVLYTLRDGRRIQGGRKEAREDNGWSPFIADLTIHEVAGNHDSMVLEPQVRGLAALIKRVLVATETKLRQAQSPGAERTAEIETATAAHSSSTSRPEGVA